MKKIEAVIRKSKFYEVKTALHEVGVNFFSYWDVNAVRNDYLTSNASHKKDPIEKSYLSIVVNDDFEDVTIKAILESASTEQIGDGRIYITNIDHAYKIRTKESGPKTLR